MITIGFSNSKQFYYLVSNDEPIICNVCKKNIEDYNHFILNTFYDFKKKIRQVAYCQDCFNKDKSYQGYVSIIYIDEIIPIDLIPVLPDTLLRGSYSNPNKVFQGGTILSDDDIKQDQINKVTYITRGKLISMDENRNIMPEYEQAQIELKLRAEAEKVIPKTSEDVDNFFDNLLGETAIVESKTKQTKENKIK